MSAARLARLRRRARLVLEVEAVAVAALWPAGVIVTFLIACLLGIGGWQTDLVGLIALGAAIRHGIRTYHAPATGEIDRRIERDSRLDHRPIAALEDYPALIEPGAMPLWEAHRTRLERALASARVGAPTPDFAAHDPFALRALLLLVLVAAWIAAGSEAGNRLAASLRVPALFSSAGIGVQAWITPPRWAGTTPHLIDAGTQPVEVLKGSTLSLIVTGAGSGAPSTMLGGRTLDFSAIDAGSYRTHHRLERSATLVIGPFWHRIARYRIEIITPTPPSIGFASPPAPNTAGKRVDLAWRGTSHYGLSRLELRLTPSGIAGTLPDDANLSTRHAAGDSISGKARLDLRASPFAGMTVDGVLAATNRNGQTGTSAPASFTLPAPMLHNRTAQALEAVRRALALNRTSRAELADRLKRIANAPPERITPETQKAIASFATVLEPFKPSHARAEATLWTLVQRAELGVTYRTAQQLAAARHAVERAIRQALAGHPPERQKFQQLMSRLNRSVEAQKQAESRNGMRESETQKQQMSAIDQLARKIERELGAGQTEQARRDMKRLQRMLGQMQDARPQFAARQARQQAGERAGQHLSRIMRQEAQLMNQTSREGRTPRPGNQATRQPNQASQALAGRQQALQQQLDAEAQSMASSGLKPLPQIGQGQAAMKGAHGHLERGDMAGAVPAERAAIHALQEAQNALQAMRGGQGSGGGPSGIGQQAASGQGEYGNQSNSTVSLGRAGTHSDARRIQGELIQRDAKPNLPGYAHRYYGRLLGEGF